MKLMCSWCLSEGRLAYLGERGTMSDSRVSHAICEGHLVQLRAESQTTRTRPSTYHENLTVRSRTSAGSKASAISMPSQV